MAAWRLDAAGSVNGRSHDESRPIVNGDRSMTNDAPAAPGSALDATTSRAAGNAAPGAPPSAMGRTSNVESRSDGSSSAAEAAGGRGPPGATAGAPPGRAARRGAPPP